MYVIEINGELEESDNARIYTELDHLSVQLSINEEGDRPQHHCGNCDTPEVAPCPDSGNWAPCTECNGSKKCSVCEGINPADCTLCNGSGKCDECDDDGDIEVHDWQPVPLHWCNSASIHARPDRDSIQVTISVGDPRGAFVMEVERREDGLYLSVPHPDQSSPHMPLTERTPGWYKVGD